LFRVILTGTVAMVTYYTIKITLVVHYRLGIYEISLVKLCKYSIVKVELWKIAGNCYQPP